MDDGVSQNRHGRQYEVEYAESEREAPSIRFGPDLSQGQKECRFGCASGRRPDGRTAFIRVVCRWVDGRLHAHPVSGQSSHQLAAAADANALAVVPDGDGIAEGDEVTVVLLTLPT